MSAYNDCRYNWFENKGTKILRTSDGLVIKTSDNKLLRVK